MKTVLLSLTIIFATCMANAQMQKNFIGNDCNGQQHDLFAELDQGKVIVLCWVMPCGVCAGAAKTSYNIVKSYQAQYPGKVLFYLVDDYGNTACNYVNSWANTQNLAASDYSITFSNQSLNMTDFGTTGMPKVVIIGGSDHKIYYNANNQVNSDLMLAAINSAIDQTTDVASDGEVEQTTQILFPNPANHEVSLSFTVRSADDVKIDLVNADGETVKNFGVRSLDAGSQTISLSVASLPMGTYFVRVHTHEGMNVSKCIISR